MTLCSSKTFFFSVSLHFSYFVLVLFSFCEQLSFGDNILVRDGRWVVSSFPLVAGTLSSTDMCKPCTYCKHLCEFMGALVLLFPQGPPSPLVFTLFLPPLPWGSQLGWSVSRSLTLCTMSGCGSLHPFLPAFEEASQTMIYESKKILLEIILLISFRQETLHLCTI